jgi:hypothetical protein
MSDEPKTFDFFGLPVTLGTDEECAAAQYLVCTTADTPNPWHDNKLGNCAICAVPIQYRPYMPEKPMKICMKCFMKVARPS